MDLEEIAAVLCIRPVDAAHLLCAAEYECLSLKLGVVCA
jgi:hypothetical protein